MKWGVPEGNGYVSVENKEEAFEAGENPELAEIRHMEDWCRRSLIEREDTPLMG